VDAPIVLEPGDSFAAKDTERHLFFSLSTLSNEANAIIGGIGFIVMDPRSAGPPDTHYFKPVDWEQQGRAYTFPVIQEWMRRSTMARKGLVDQAPPVQITDALRALAVAYKTHNCGPIWGNPVDLRVLRNAMHAYKIDIPWDETCERDVVSVWGALDDLGMMPPLERGLTEPQHVALGEAAFIARGTAMIYRGFTNKPTQERVLEQAK